MQDTTAAVTANVDDWAQLHLRHGQGEGIGGLKLPPRHMKKDTYHVNRMDDSLDSLGEAQSFSMFD